MTFGFRALGTGYRVIGAKFNASSQFLKKGIGVRSFSCRDLALTDPARAAKECRVLNFGENYSYEKNQ